MMGVDCEKLKFRIKKIKIWVKFKLKMGEN